MRLATYTLRSNPDRVRIGAQLDGDMLDLIASERAVGDGKTLIPFSMKGVLALGESGLVRARTVLEFARHHASRLPAGTLTQDDDVRYLPPASLYVKPGDIIECAFESPAMTLCNRIIAPHPST